MQAPPEVSVNGPRAKDDDGDDDNIQRLTLYKNKSVRKKRNSLWASNCQIPIHYRTTSDSFDPACAFSSHFLGK